jgi:hypothetical protein
MVLGETVHSFGIAVQIRELSLRCDGSGTRMLSEKQAQCRMTDTPLKDFLSDANANRKLCIALEVNGQNSSPSAEHGEGL